MSNNKNTKINTKITEVKIKKISINIPEPHMDHLNKKNLDHLCPTEVNCRTNDGRNNKIPLTKRKVDTYKALSYQEKNVEVSNKQKHDKKLENHMNYDESITYRILNEIKTKKRNKQIKSYTANKTKVLTQWEQKGTLTKINYSDSVPHNTHSDQTGNSNTNNNILTNNLTTLQASNDQTNNTTIPQNNDQQQNNIQQPPQNNNIRLQQQQQQQPETEKIIQWNINGFYSRLDDIKLLVEEQDPTVLCLQETRLSRNDRGKLTGYKGFFHNGPRRQQGTAIFVKHDTLATRIPLISHINAVAARVGLSKKISICSLYISPLDDVPLEDLNDLMRQLPPPFIITGDFNAHNTTWGCSRIDRRGRTIERFVEENGLVILNTGEMTRFDIRHGTSSAIDLTVASAELAVELGWYVINELHNSDHYPTVTTLSSERSAHSMRKRWIMEKANWKKYREQVEQNLQISNKINIQEITKAIQKAAADNIKQTSGNPPSKKIKWMTDELRELIRERRRAERKLKSFQHCTTENITNYQRLKATSRLLLKRARKEEWETFANTITRTTPSKEIWGKIRAISGKRKNGNIIRLRVGGCSVEQPKEIANHLANHFASVSATCHYPSDFQRRKTQEEIAAVQVNMLDTSCHNNPFTMKEMNETLPTCVGKSPGPDNINYEMIRQLGEKTKEKLLNVYNQLWKEGDFPEEWRKANVIPIKKPGKDPEIPDSYRPVSLTSCLCKVMEKMANRRLVHILEERKLIPPQQFGFRSGKSTTDVLNILQSEISGSFLDRQHLAMISLDLSKAYDTCWRYGITRWLKAHSIDGRMLKFITNFLEGRKLKTLVGSQESEEQEIENGVVQGAVLSVTLFLVAIANICSSQENYKMIGYADDWYIYTSGKNITQLQHILQQALNKIDRWTQRTGFSISREKTKCIVFTKSKPRRGQTPLTVELRGQVIEEVNSLKILGLTFDKRLTWKTHVKNAKIKAKQRLNIIRCLAGTTWGADREVLLKAHHAIILSALRYGETAYGSASESILKALEPIHNQGLRIAIGAFCITKTTEVLREAGALSLKELRKKSIAICGIRTLEKGNHPLNAPINSNLRERLERNPTLPAPFPLRVRNQLDNYGLGNQKIQQDIDWNLPPWEELDDDMIDTDMIPFSKENRTIIMQNFQQQLEKYHQHEHIYTDGSKTENKVGFSIVKWDGIVRKRLPDPTTVYSAEATAIRDAGVGHLESWETKLILTDSLSTLQAVRNSNKNSIIKCITKLLYDGGGNVKLKWIPGHAGILGNEQADQEAKKACNISAHSGKLTADDAILFIKNITKISDKPHTPKDSTRKQQVALARWRMGYTKKTHKHIIEKTPPPLCEQCNLTDTVDHILMHCEKYNIDRLTTGLTTNYRNGSEEDSLRLLLFLENTGLINEG